MQGSRAEIISAGVVQAGDMLYTASMAPIMAFLEDSGPGVHDTTAAACSHGLYVLQIGEARAASVCKPCGYYGFRV